MHNNSHTTTVGCALTLLFGLARNASVYASKVSGFTNMLEQPAVAADIFTRRNYLYNILKQCVDSWLIDALVIGGSRSNVG